MTDFRSQIKPGQDLPSSFRQRLVNWRFVALSSLFFIIASLVFFAAFSAQRINAHKSEQAAAASAFISQLTVLAENTRGQNLDDLLGPFLGALAGFKIFNCVSLSIESPNRSYAWPYQNCESMQERDKPGLQVIAHRTDRPSARISIDAFLDDGTPIEKFADEAGHIAISALIMGLIGLLAVNLAFNKAVRQPLTSLLEQLYDVLSSSGEKPSSGGDWKSQVSTPDSTYELLLERAKELKRKEAFWRAVTDSSFNCVICTDNKGCIIDFNTASEKAFGYSRDNIIGSQISDLVTLEEYHNALNPNSSSYLDVEGTRGTGSKFETTARHADGSEFFIELSIVGIEVDNERFFTAYLRDITEEKRTLKNLEENETMLTQSAEIAELGYAVWDDVLDRDIMVTDELARIHGFTKDGYLETVSSMEAYLELVVPEDRERYMAFENQFAEDLVHAAGVEYRVKRPDGETRYLHQRAQYLPVPDGRSTRSIVVIQDVTDQRQVEARLFESRQALEENEALLIQSAAMSDMAHAIWDETRERHIFVSAGWAGIHGYSSGEFLAKFSNLNDEIKLIHPEDRDHFLDWIDKYEGDDGVPGIEYRIIRSDGVIRHLQERAKILSAETGQQTKSLVTIQDITDRIEREIELSQAKKAAEQASVAKSSFLAMMSHEIRTPLNAILGVLGLLDSKELDPSQKRFLNVGRKGAESLLLIINDILDFSKIEAGKLPLEPILFNLQKTIDDVLQVLEPRALGKKIWLTGVADPDVPEYMIGDASRIRQVLLNLCSNAVRFTGRGGVHINISQTREEDQATSICFRVEDTGSGVPLEDQVHLFDEFWGTNVMTSDKTGGTGLGLPISKRLVEMMGGSIGFESVPGCGSAFWFELPLEVPDEEAVDAERNKPRKFEQIAPYEDLPSLQGRVLLAEDNPANQLIAQVMLERFGLQVDVAANGHETVSMLRGAPYDLVLMDINMPEMGGVEATEIIREQPGALSRMPVIAMTALAMPGDRENFLSMGMDGYISKPVIREELHACIASVLEDRMTAADNSSGSSENERADANPSIIDVKVVETLKLEVGVERLPDIIESYLSEAQNLVEEIMEGSDRGDCEQVARGAHPLKSSSANLGAMMLAELAKQLEYAGSEQDLERIQQEVLRLPGLFRKTREKVHRVRLELEPAG